MFKPFHQNKGGFTLVELLVVISIISMLSSTVLVTVTSARIKARDTRRVQDLAELKKAIDLYYDDNGIYPLKNTTHHGAYGDVQGPCLNNTDRTWECLKNELVSRYIPSLPEDPLHDGFHEYMYQVLGDTYNLIVRVEDPNSPLRCSVAHWQDQTLSSFPGFDFLCSPNSVWTAGDYIDFYQANH